MRAIEIRIYPPTNHRGCRVAGFVEGKRVFVAQYKYELSDQLNHVYCAQETLHSLGWVKRLRECDYKLHSGSIGYGNTDRGAHILEITQGNAQERIGELP